MRTKTLLIASAALAVGILTSSAQTYSQNIVGYANVVIPGSSAFSVLSAPLSGNTNLATTVLPAMEGGELIYVWNGGGYYVYQYLKDFTVENPTAPSDWLDYSGGNNIPGDVYSTDFEVWFATEPKLSPGQGFILQNPNGTYTNTFTGTVVLSSTNNPVPLAGSSAISLIGSVVPLAGNLQTNTAIHLTLNGGELIYKWNGGGYYVYQYLQGFTIENPTAPSDWLDYSGGNNIPGDVYSTDFEVWFAPAPTVTVGEGFFYANPNDTTNWTQNVTVPD